MCRNIKTLFNFEPPLTEDEIRLAALQFVCKLSGINKLSNANDVAFLVAVDAIAAASSTLLNSLETNASQGTVQKKPRRCEHGVFRGFPGK